MHKDGFALLTEDLERNGERFVLDAVVTRIAEGEDPKDIARSRGYSWYVLRKWMEDSPERMAEWSLAKRCFADGLAYKGMAAASDATIADVAVRKLQVDSYSKAAGKMNRDEWGERMQVETTVMVSIVDALKEARGRVEEIKTDRLPAMRVPVTVENGEVVET